MEIKILPSAKKQLEKLDKKLRERIISAVKKLEDPTKVIDKKKMKTRISESRIRVGEYRVFVTEENGDYTVIEIAHRREAYR